MYGRVKHKATKAPRKPASNDLLVAGFLGAFVALCLHASVLNVLNDYGNSKLRGWANHKVMSPVRVFLAKILL